MFITLQIAARQGRDAYDTAAAVFQVLFAAVMNDIKREVNQGQRCDATQQLFVIFNEVRSLLMIVIFMLIATNE